MSIKPKPEIEKLKACPHGGPDHAELKRLGLTAEGVIDFSVSSNPFSFPPGIKRALSSVALDRYPDSESTELREALSERLGVAPSNILAGSGSMEIIRLVAQAYFGSGDSVLILKPTFGEYEVAVRLVGADTLEYRAGEENYFAFDIDEAAALIKKHRPRGVFICNPNNPTGQYLSRPEVETVMDASGDTLLILDEAYIAFTESSWPSTGLISRGNLISVRSMTKDYALAGLRLGYAVSSEEIIRTLAKVRPPWNVNAVAQKAGAIALKDSGYLERCEVKIRQARRYLSDELGRLGLKVLPSKTNFFLVKVGNGKSFRTALLRHGIMVRDCASFGLPQYVRIAPLAMPQCKKLINAVKALKQKGKIG